MSSKLSLKCPLKRAQSRDFLYSQNIENLRKLDRVYIWPGKIFNHPIVECVMRGDFENREKCTYVKALEIIWDVYSERHGKHEAGQELVNDVRKLNDRTFTQETSYNSIDYKIKSTRYSCISMAEVMRKPYKWYPHNLLHKAIKQEIYSRFKDHEITIMKSLNILHRHYGFFLNEYESNCGSATPQV